MIADYPTARLQDRAEYKRTRSAEADKELGLLYVLLALAVLIALLGITNTLRSAAAGGAGIPVEIGDA